MRCLLVGGCCQLVLWLLAIYLVFFRVSLFRPFKKSFKDDKCKLRRIKI